MEFFEKNKSKRSEGSRIEHGYLTEEKVSMKLIKFLSEDVSLKQAFKHTLLDNAFSKWKKLMHLCGQKERIEILDKKRERRKQWVPAIEVSHAYVRWIKCTKETMMTSVKNSAVLLASGYFVFVYDINMDNYLLYSPADVDGIGCIRGSQEEDFFAFSEKINEPSIYVVTYPNLQTAFILRDQYNGKVIDLQFGNNGLLLSLKCDFAEHRVVVWYWRCTYVLCSYVLDKPQIHPEYFSASLEGTYYALLQEYHGKTLLQFWYLKILCDESLLVKKYISDITLENYIFHDMQYDTYGVLHLIDEKGNLYTYDVKSKKANILIPWEPTSQPVDDVVEHHMTTENFLPKRRRVDIEESPVYVKEDFKSKEEDESKAFKFKRYEYEDVASDIYESEPKKERRKSSCKADSEHPCYFVWFKDGMVVSGPDSKLKYYTKDAQSGKWSKAWGMIPSDPLRYMVTNQKRDRLFGWSEYLGLKEIKPMETSNSILHFFGGSIKRIVLLHPYDNFLVTLNTTRTICIWKKKTGQLMNSVKLSCDMKDMEIHQSSSLIALFPYDEGSIYGIDLTNPRVPTIWPVLKLYRKQSFAWIKFLDDDWLIACTDKRVEVVLIKASIYHGFEVISSYKFYYEIINMIGVLAQDCVYYGVALYEKVQPGSQMVPKGYVAGKMFEVIKFPALIHERAFSSENFYKNIYTGPGLGHVLAMPADIKFELHSYYIDIKEGGTWRLLRRITVDHQIGAFEIHIAEQHYITYGFDGHIFVHDSSDLLDNDNRPLSTLRNHHRWDGVQQAVVDYQGKYVISLGQEGHLICSRIKYKFWCRHPLHVPKKTDQEIRNPLTKIIFKHVVEYEGEFWEDVIARKKYEYDRLLAECRIVRIKNVFEDLKKMWNEYYEQNKMESEENRLSEEEFELDKDRLPIIKSVVNKEIVRLQKDLTGNLKFYQEWIGYWKELCWGRMYTKLYRIKPFQARFFLENFNQSLKPYKYVCYHYIIDNLSRMSAAIFPLPEPKMLPWNKLDENNEFPEMKMQKDAYQEVEENEVDEEVEKDNEKQFMPVQEHKEDEEKGEEEGNEEEYEVYEEEVEVEEEEEIVQSESSEDICGSVKENICTEEEIKQIKFIEEELKKDDEELKLAPKRQMTIDEILAVDQALKKAKNQGDNNPELMNKPFFTPEELKEIAAWKKDQLKTYWEGTLSQKEKEKLLIQVLDKLLKDDKRKFKKMKAIYGIEVDEEESSVEEEDIFETEKKDEVEEEKKTKVKALGNDEEGEEGEVEEAAGSQEHGGMQELEGDLYLKSLEEDESLFSWSDIAYEEFAQEKPKKVEKSEIEKPITKENDNIDDTIVPKRPAALPAEETVQEEENPELPPPDPFDEPYYMTGSQTPKFIEVNFARYNEFTSNGIFMADSHITALKGVIENLEGAYNEIFNEDFVKKAKDLLLIKKKQREIRKNIDDLTNICQVEAPSPPAIEYTWSKGEVPEWIFKFEPSEEEFCKLIKQIFIKYSNEKPLTEREQLLKELKELETHKISEEENESNANNGILSGDAERNKNEIDEDEIFKLHTLHEMMDGVIEMSWQEIVKKGVELPAFVNEKDPESYTERERIAMNNYKKAVKEIEEKRKYHANLASQEIEKLKAEIKDIASTYDIGLLETTRKRILIESCMQSELLKIARLKLRRLTADKGVGHINFLKSQTNKYLDKGVEITMFLKYLQRKLALILKEVEKYELMPNKIERDFLKKINPLSLPKKIIETFKILIKTKPAFTDEFEKNACSNEVHAMAAYLDQNYKPIYASKASEKYFKSLEELDSIKNCPPNIDSEVWSLVIHFRNAMLSANMKGNIYRNFIPSLEKITYKYFKHYLTHLERITKIHDTVDLEEELLANHCKKMELVLPDGLVETRQTGDIEDFADCVYISKSYIDKLNEDIMELEKHNHEKLKEIDDQMNSVFDTELLHKELRLRIKIEENTLKDIRFMRTNKYVRDYLAELKMSDQEPYDAKDYDLVRAEKLRKIVRKYFKKYYDALKNVKKAKEDQRNLIKENMMLEKKINKVTVMNQAAKDRLTPAEMSVQKPLQDKNEAIIFKGELTRKVEENHKEIENLWEELERLKRRSIPILDDNYHS